VGFAPRMQRVMDGAGAVSTLGRPLVDAYLGFVGARGAMNTWLATVYDPKVFFEVVCKEPAEARSADVFAFVADQRAPRRGEKVVRIEDGEAGLAARTIARRLSSVAGLFEYLLARADAGVVSNPVPRRLASGRPGRTRSGWCAAGAHSPDVAEGALAAGDRRAAWRAAHGGIGRSCSRRSWWPAPLRGAQPRAR
jgi:integrase/recombinase XerD